MANRKKIKVYKTNDAIKSRIDYGKYYAVQSEIEPSMMYIISDKEIAIVQNNLTFRVPIQLFDEFAALTCDIKWLRSMDFKMEI